MQGHGMHKSIEFSYSEFILLHNTTCEVWSAVDPPFSDLSVSPPAHLRPLGCAPASNLSAAHPPPTSRRSTHLPTHTHLRSLPSHPPPTDLSAAYPPPTDLSAAYPPPTSQSPHHPPLGRPSTSHLSATGLPPTFGRPYSRPHRKPHRRPPTSYLSAAQQKSKKSRAKKKNNF